MVSFGKPAVACAACCAAAAGITGAAMRLFRNSLRAIMPTFSLPNSYASKRRAKKIESLSLGTRLRGPTMNFLTKSLIGLTVLAVAAAAQTGGGATLVGTVRDTSGALVAGAKVTVVNTGTSF